MKQVKFDPKLIDSILSGEKTSTWRIYDDKELTVGDSIGLVNKATGDVFATAKITQTMEKYLRDIDSRDMDGHKIYQSAAEMYDELRVYYGSEIGPNTIVKIVRFSVNESKKDTNVVKNNHILTEVKLYTDGGSRGNPGPSASGWVILDLDNNVVKNNGKYLGITTNNQAEYQAVLLGLEECFELGVREVQVYMDSLLVVNQMTGVFKIKNRDLWPINQAIKEKSQQFKKVTFTHVPRELNKLADAEVNKTLDAQKN